MKNVKQVQELSLEDLELVGGGFPMTVDTGDDADPSGDGKKGGIGWTPSGNNGKGA